MIIHEEQEVNLQLLSRLQESGIQIPRCTMNGHDSCVLVTGGFDPDTWWTY